jgi:hypothetical protein
MVNHGSVAHGVEIGKRVHIATCLCCGNFGPEGKECAHCWTQMKCYGEEEQPHTVIYELKYYIEHCYTSWQTVYQAEPLHNKTINQQWR